MTRHAASTLQALGHLVTNITGFSDQVEPEFFEQCEQFAQDQLLGGPRQLLKHYASTDKRQIQQRLQGLELKYRVWGQSRRGRLLIRLANRWCLAAEDSILCWDALRFLLELSAGFATTEKSGQGFRWKAENHEDFTRDVDYCLVENHHERRQRDEEHRMLRDIFKQDPLVGEHWQKPSSHLLVSSMENASPVDSDDESWMKTGEEEEEDGSGTGPSKSTMDGITQGLCDSFQDVWAKDQKNMKEIREWLTTIAENRLSGQYWRTSTCPAPDPQSLLYQYMEQVRSSDVSMKYNPLMDPYRLKCLLETHLMMETLFMLTGGSSIVYENRADGAIVVKLHQYGLQHLTVGTVSHCLAQFAQMGTDLKILKALTADMMDITMPRSWKAFGFGIRTLVLDPLRHELNRLCKVFVDWQLTEEESLVIHHASLLQLHQLLMPKFRIVGEVLNFTLNTKIEVLMSTENGCMKSLKLVHALYLCVIQKQLLQSISLDKPASSSFQCWAQLFIEASIPVLDNLGQWLYRGILPNDEFVVVNQDKANLEDFWSDGTDLDSQCIAWLKSVFPPTQKDADLDIWKKILLVGKSVRLAKCIAESQTSCGFSDHPLLRQNSLSRAAQVFSRELFTGVQFSSEPLQLSLRNWITNIIDQRYQEVSSWLVSELLGNCGLKEQFAMLRQVFFMEDGYLMSLLSDSIFTDIRNNVDVSVHSIFQDVASEKSASFLRSFLWKLQPKKSSVSCKKEPEKYFTDLFERLSVEFYSPWPLNHLIDSATLETYNRVMRLLFSMRFAQWSLTDLPLLRDRRLSLSQSSEVANFLKYLFKIRLDLLHFVNCWSHYVLNTILKSATEKFLTDLEECSDIAKLVHIHSNYIRTIHDRCLLHDRAAALHRSITGSLQLCVSFNSICDKFHRFIAPETYVIESEDNDAVQHSVNSHDNNQTRPPESNTKFVDDCFAEIQSIKGRHAENVRFVTNSFRIMTERAGQSLPHLEGILRQLS